MTNEEREHRAGLEPAERRRCQEIGTTLELRFEAYMRTVKPEYRMDHMHPCNRDEYLRGFGEWLAEQRPEFASND